MTAEEFRENMYKGNAYNCGFCGKEIKDEPTLTLCLCRGIGGRDITDICEECLNKIEERVIL